jgi:hypothetical protein
MKHPFNGCKTYHGLPGFLQKLANQRMMRRSPGSPYWILIGDADDLHCCAQSE